MEKQRKIAILGAKGMLGADLVKFLGDRYSIVSITRENYPEHKGENFDVLINANGNSKRFWGNQHPLEDFKASTLSVYESLVDFSVKKYIYISSIAVYEDPSSPATTKEDHAVKTEKLQPYGLHKRLSETIVASAAKDYLILRCPIILGTSMKRGTFYDILVGHPLFVVLSSKLQLITSEAIAEIISIFIEKNVSGEIFNIGGIGAFSLGEVSRYFGKSAVVSEGAEEQIYEMDISKLKTFYSPKKSEEYLQDFLKNN